MSGIRVQEFLSAIERFEGVAVSHRGSDLTGADCIGVPIGALKLCGIEIDHGIQYGTWPNADKLTQGLEKFCTKTMELRPGVLLQVFAGQSARHIQTYLGENKVGQGLVMQAWGKRARVQKMLFGARLAQIWKINAVDYESK